jgi:chaperonin GroEL
MPYINLLFEAVARGNVLHGATPLAETIRLILLPKSKWVLIRKWGTVQDEAL